MYRFAFDIGSGSLGWAVIELDPQNKAPKSIANLGVRIFSTGRDPKSKESNAAGRRQPRQQRRQLFRRKKRSMEVEARLVEAGLMPSASDAAGRTAFFAIDPYEARGKAANERVEPFVLGRAIWHMSKHRGFKSNRKTDRANEDESGKIATGASELRAKLVDAGVPTYGAWLAARHENREAVRVRRVGEGATSAYEFYPLRVMLEDEFDFIWRIQAGYHASLSDGARDAIKDAVFFQRSLKRVKPGRCTFFPEEPRLPRWHPMAQEFIILQQLNMLRILNDDGEAQLDITARGLLARHLMSGQKLTWSSSKKGLRGVLGKPSEVKFNLEEGGLKELAHNTIAARFEGTTAKPGPLHRVWNTWADQQQLTVLTILNDAASSEDAIQRLMSEAGLPREVAEKIEKIPLPDGHLMLGLRAVTAILEVMRRDVVVYSEAVRIASEEGSFGEGAVVHHSDLRPADDPGMSRLPRYNELEALQRMIGTGTGAPNDPHDTRYGRISNPTVHIALGQFRRVMNALIDHYGKPSQIVIETTRDMAKSTRELNEIESTIRKNTKRNDKWRKDLEDAGILTPGQRVGDRLMRMRLWEELGNSPADRVCPYSGRPISLHELHSDAVEIDHILPFEDTFDDSPNNKVVCFRASNRIKGKRAPADAWHGEELEKVLARVKGSVGLSRKLWRFLPGAMERWEEEKGFEDRQLHATGYLAKVLRAYAETLFPKDGTSNLWLTPGRMTAMLRRRWGLFLPDHNTKTRDDHRHHALDAVTVGMIDRGMIQRLQTYARRMGVQELDRLMPTPPEPFEGFGEQARSLISKINVSHRPNHSVSGRLQEDTAYGLIRDYPENQAARTIGNVVVRKPVTSLTAKEVRSIRDEHLRAEVLKATKGALSDPKALSIALRSWSEQSKVNRLRILKPAASVKPIHDAKGNAYKWLVPGEMAFIDILEGPDQSWFLVPTDIWSAQKEEAKSWRTAHPRAQHIMRLYKGDTVQLFDLDDAGEPIAGSNQIKRVVRLQPSANRVHLVGTNDAGNYDQRHNDPDDPFRWDLATISRLKARRARRVRIDELGRVRSVPHGMI